MKKKNFLITLLSMIMAISLSVPAIMAFADDAGSATVPKTLAVEIFNGNADNVTLKSATAVDDNGTTVVSVSNAWSGFIMLKETIDLSAAKEKACSLCHPCRNAQNTHEYIYHPDGGFQT